MGTIILPHCLDKLSGMDKPRRYLTPEEELEELEKEAQRGREAFLVNVPLDESLEYSAAFLNGFEEARADHCNKGDKE